MPSPAPFEGVFRPAVTAARRDLQTRCGPAWAMLAESAVNDLESALVRVLSALLAPALELRFSLFRHFAAADDTGLYRRFVSDVDLSSELRDYPALSALMNRVIGSWADSWVEFSSRLERDFTCLENMFAPGRKLGKVVRIQPDLSDRHAGGRAVAAIAFECGVEIIYKPKSCESDEALYRILGWLNGRDECPSFLIPAILNRELYAWMAFIAQKPCTSEEQVRAYFQRAGGLVCVAYVFGGSDCHFDNLIASGEHPVIVDTETFFQPSERPLPGRAARASTVVSTGLLPGMLVFGCDISGFGATEPQQVDVRVPAWSDTNTDRMRIRFKPAVLQPRMNAARLSAAPCRMKDYVPAVLEGFETTYRAVRTYRSDLLARGGPVEAICDARVRFLVRDTLDYYFAVNQALQLKNVRAAEQLAIQLPDLPPRRALFSGLRAGEQSDLRRLDIPRFTTAVTSTSLEGPDIVLNNCFELSGYERVIRKLQELDEPDLTRQLALMRVLLS